MKISVIIPSHNRCDLLTQTLPPLLEQSREIGGVEILLIDDASTVDYRQTLATAGLLNHIRFVRLNDNVGQAAAQNVGARQALGELLIFLDDDLEVGRQFFQGHVCSHASKNRSLIIGIQLIPNDVASDSFGRYRAHKDNCIYQNVDGHQDEVILTSGLTNANLSIRRDDFFAIGTFKVSGVQRLASVDYEFGWRARRLGYSVYVNPAIKTIHHDVNIVFDRYLKRMSDHGFAHVDLRRLNPEMATDPMLAEEYFMRGPFERKGSLRQLIKKAVLRSLALTPLAYGSRMLARLAERAGAPDWLAFRLFELAVQAYYQRGYNAGVHALGRTAFPRVARTDSPTAALLAEKSSAPTGT